MVRVIKTSLAFTYLWATVEKPNVNKLAMFTIVICIRDAHRYPDIRIIYYPDKSGYQNICLIIRQYG